MSDITDSQINLIPTTVIDEEPELTTDVDLTQVKNKGCLSSFCIKFSKGYKTYTILQLTSSSITIVCMTLPYILHTFGVIEGGIIIFLLSLFLFYTMNLMLELIIKTGAISYYYFLNYNIGKKTSNIYATFNFIYLISLIMILDYFSLCFICDFIMAYFKINQIATISKFVFGLILVIGIQFPFSVKPYEVVHLIGQYLTMLTVMFGLVIIFVQMLIKANNIKKDSIVLFKKSNWDMLYSIGIIILIFNSHNNLFENFKGFKINTKKRQNKVILIHFITIFLIVLAFAYIGYFLSLSANSNSFNSIILLTSNELVTSPFAKALLYILKLLLVISFQFKIISLISKMKEEIKFISHNQISTIISILLSIFIPLISCAISLFVRNILTIIGIAGGICSCIICFAIPSYAYSVLVTGNSIQEIINFIVMIGGILLGGFITVFAFIDSYKIELNI